MFSWFLHGSAPDFPCVTFFQCGRWALVLLLWLPFFFFCLADAHMHSKKKKMGAVCNGSTNGFTGINGLFGGSCGRLRVAVPLIFLFLPRVLALLSGQWPFCPIDSWVKVRRLFLFMQSTVLEGYWPHYRLLFSKSRSIGHSQVEAACFQIFSLRVVRGTSLCLRFREQDLREQDPMTSKWAGLVNLILDQAFGVLLFVSLNCNM